MSINAACVWEVRSSATAGNLNGGGFVTGGGGTDYSQQDAAQYNFADLASTNANTATPDVTSASHTFDAADVGNIMHITAGTQWTAGWYEIVSVAAGAARLDRACGSAATPSGAGTFYVGGALSLGAATDAAWATSTNLRPGNTVHIKSGTYTLGAAVTFLNGTAGAPVEFIGYTTTRGDACTGASRPMLDTTTLNSVFGNYNKISNIQTNCTTGTWTCTSGQLVAINSSFRASTAGNYALASFQGMAVGCEFQGYTGGVSASGNTTFMNCYFHDSLVGIVMAGASISVIGCIFINCPTQGIDIGGNIGANIINNTFYGSPTPAGIGVKNTASAQTTIINNIFYGLTDGIKFTSAATSVKNNIEDYNAFNNVTTARTNYPTGANSITTDPTFSSISAITGTNGTTSGSVLTSAGADFSTVTDNQDWCYLISGTGITVNMYKITSHTGTTLTFDVAPGTNATANKNFRIVTGRDLRVGTTMKAMGIPGAAIYNLPTAAIGYMDLGALQRVEPTGGTGTVKTSISSGGRIAAG